MTYTIKIGSTDISAYLKGYEVERNKLWTDANRNLNGDLKATFIGIFPKIKLSFTYLTESELKTVIGLLDAPSFSVNWWDSGTGNYGTDDYYSGDYSFPLFNKSKGLYESFEVNLIPYKKL